MDKAKSLHDTLVLDVFQANNLGRRFYRGYGFSEQSESVHAATGQTVLTLLYSA